MTELETSCASSRPPTTFPTLKISLLVLVCLLAAGHPLGSLSHQFILSDPAWVHSAGISALPTSCVLRFPTPVHPSTMRTRAVAQTALALGGGMRGGGVGVFGNGQRRRASATKSAKQTGEVAGGVSKKNKKTATRAEQQSDSETFIAPFTGGRIDVEHTSGGLELAAKIVAEFEKLRNNVAAKQQAKYVKGKFFFFGIKTPEIRKITKTVLKQSAPLSREDVASFAATAFEHREREMHYAGISVLSQHPLSIDLDLARRFVMTGSWWDSVDMLAINVVGPIVMHDRAAGSATMKAWVKDEHLWVLHQLHFKQNTDVDLLLKTCKGVMLEEDFFMRKAVGWALRHFSRTDPDAVRRFCAEHEGELSPLSYREARRLLPECKP